MKTTTSCLGWALLVARSIFGNDNFSDPVCRKNLPATIGHIYENYYQLFGVGIAGSQKYFRKWQFFGSQSHFKDLVIS